MLASTRNRALLQNIKDTTRLISSVSDAATKEQLARLAELFVSVSTEIAKALEVTIEYQNSGEIPAIVFGGVVSRGREEYTKLLVRNTKDALERISEFDLPRFRNPLLEIVKVPEIIEIIPTSYSRNSAEFQVKILINQYAGTIDDYFNAVNLARYALQGLDPDSPDAVLKGLPAPMAGFMWAEKYYKPAREGTRVTRTYKTGKNAGKEKDITAKYVRKYWRTINLRLGFFEGKAPYWYLLEHGNASGNLGSYATADSQKLTNAGEEGNKPYPIYGGTNFIARTEMQIKLLITVEYLKKMSMITNDYAEVIKQLTTALQELREATVKIADLLSKSYSPEELYSRIATAFAEAVTKTNSALSHINASEREIKQVMEVVSALAYDIINDPSILEKGRIEIMTIRGARVRPRTAELRKQLLGVIERVDVTSERAMEELEKLKNKVAGERAVTYFTRGRR